MHLCKTRLKWSYESTCSFWRFVCKRLAQCLICLCCLERIFHYMVLSKIWNGPSIRLYSLYTNQTSWIKENYGSHRLSLTGGRCASRMLVWVGEEFSNSRTSESLWQSCLHPHLVSKYVGICLPIPTTPVRVCFLLVSSFPKSVPRPKPTPFPRCSLLPC